MSATSRRSQVEPRRRALTHRRESVEERRDIGHDTPLVWWTSIAQIRHVEQALVRMHETECQHKAGRGVYDREGLTGMPRCSCATLKASSVFSSRAACVRKMEDQRSAGVGERADLV